MGVKSNAGYSVLTAVTHDGGGGDDDVGVDVDVDVGGVSARKRLAFRLLLLCFPGEPCIQMSM